MTAGPDDAQPDAGEQASEAAGSPGNAAPAFAERARSPARGADVPADEGQVESCSEDDESERTPATDAPAAATRPGTGTMVVRGSAPADDAAGGPGPAETTGLPAQGATGDAPGTSSGGGDVFSQARRFLDHMEREFRARERALDSREAALASREEELANARAVFQETVQKASSDHKGSLAFLELKTREFVHLQERLNRDAEITTAGLDQYKRKTRAMTDKLIEQRALLEDREASAAEATARLQQILVAVLAAGKKNAEVSELRRTLAQRERVVDSLWDDLAVKDTANAVLDGALKNLVAQLEEAARREAGALSRLAAKEEELGVATRRAADLERALREHSSGTARLGEAVDRADDALRRVGMTPAERPADAAPGTLEDHARFLDSLSGQLAALRAAFEDTLVREGKQVAEAMATHILARVHHRDPSWPLDAIFTRIPPADRERAEAAVADHVTELVRRIARSFSAP